MPPYNPADYVDVQERITRFWTEHPNGAIRTRIESDPTDFTVCRYRAEVYKERDAPTPDATGYAFEIAGGGGANKTSHEENCETSAIGRALANMGYATSGKDRPSRQEMEKVQKAPHAPQAAQQPRSASQPPNPTPDTSQPAAIVHDEAWQAANRRVHGLLDHAIVSAAVKAKFGVASARFATKQQLDTISDLEEGKADRESVARWHEWKAKQTANQAELMPDVEAVPNVSKSPTYN